MNHNVLWGHWQPVVLSVHPVHSFVLFNIHGRFVPSLLNTEPVFLNVFGAKELIPPAYVAWRADTITLFQLGS